MKSAKAKAFNRHSDGMNSNATDLENVFFSLEDLNSIVFLARFTDFIGEMLGVSVAVKESTSQRFLR